MDFTPIETQEQFDAMVKDRIARATKTAEEKFSGYISPEELTKRTAELTKQIGGLQDQLKDSNDKFTSLSSQIAEKDSKIKEYETASVKTRIAHELDLSFEAIDFLKGEDEDSIRKSAETLKSIVGSQRSAQPLKSTEPAGQSERKAALKELLKGVVSQGE